MIKFNIAPCALSIFLGLASTYLPFISTNVSATDAAVTCKDGYEYVEAVGKCYKKCQDGWERNAETLRCRKIRTTETTSNPGSSPSSGSALTPVETPDPTPAEPVTLDGPAPIEIVADKTGETTKPSETTEPAPETETKTETETEPVSDPDPEPVVITCKDGYEYVEAVGKCYKKCQDGWERNAETLRCRKIKTDNAASETVSSEYEAETVDSETETTPATLTCKEDYEYVASAGKCYKKCQDGWYRNPETNRCKKNTTETTSSSSTSASGSTAVATCKEGYEYVASAGKCYKKCQDGWERNLETNRCRKNTTNTGADYAVAVPETGEVEQKSSFIALGVIIALAVAGLAFVAFQFRRELALHFKKLFSVFKRS